VTIVTHQLERIEKKKRCKFSSKVDQRMFVHEINYVIKTLFF